MALDCGYTVSLSKIMLVPYEVPEADLDLLDCGVVITEERMLDAGAVPCQCCGALLLPRPSFVPYCDKRCQDHYRRESFERAVLNMEKQPHVLHFAEVGHIEIVAQNALRRQHKCFADLKADPNKGFRMQVAGRSYVGSYGITLRYGQNLSKEEEFFLAVVPRITVVPMQARQLPSGLRRKGYYRRRRWGTSDEREEWVWYAHGHDWTFKEIGEAIGVTGNRAKQLYDRAWCRGRALAARMVGQVPQPHEVKCGIHGHGTVCTLRANHPLDNDHWHEDDDSFAWNGPKWRSQVFAPAGQLSLTT